jgi:signal transduction histidine kinase
MNDVTGNPLPEKTKLLLREFLHDLNNLFTFALGTLGSAQHCLNDPVELLRINNDAREIVMKSTELTSLMMHVCGGHDAPRVICSLQDIIQDAVNIGRSSISVPVQLNLIDKPCLVNVNKILMTNVFLNLLLNASHAIGKSGTISVTCAIVRSDENRRCIEAAVIDNGVGISDQSFSKEVRSTDTTDTIRVAQHGLGIGIVTRVINEYGGSIEFQPNLGKGTKVVIKLKEEERLSN